MATLMQITCLILFIGIAHSWEFPSMFNKQLSSNPFRGLINNNNSFAAIFDDMNKMMALMNQRFQNIFDSSSFSTHDWMEDRKKLDAVEPICTTTVNSPRSTSMQKGRRKKFRNTQTTTCVKELIIDGKKQLYKEMNVTDDKGILISQSKSYATIIINTNNNTMPDYTDGDRNVISY